MKTKVAKFSDWISPLTPELIFSDRQAVSNLLPWNDGLLFLLSDPSEGNSQALMFRHPDGVVIRLSPVGMNVRSRVHEYGGFPFTTDENSVFYCNFADQEIYKLTYDHATRIFSEPQVITSSEKSLVRYSDLIFDGNRNRLIAVREDHRNSGGDAADVTNQLVGIDLSTDKLPVSTDHQCIIFDQSDFVATPCLSPCYKMIAFVSWSHPNMPWDDTQIQLVALDDAGLPIKNLEVDEDCKSSKVQPLFDDQGELYFLCDRENFWNLQKCSVNLNTTAANSLSVIKRSGEFCGPPWESGRHNFSFLMKNKVVFSQINKCKWSLCEFDLQKQEVFEIHRDLGSLERIFCVDNAIFYLAATDSDYPSIYRYDFFEKTKDHAPKILFESAVPRELTPQIISKPIHFEFPSASESFAYGLFYAPKNPSFMAPNGEAPPLIVNVHGGPTGTARSGLNPLHQFWTSNGFAVADINHRGSSGYGREFRRALYPEWGVVDVEDVIAAVHFLVGNNKADANKIVIRGGSAGGYLVLASLAASDIFSAGVSYYGVTDLELLAKDTHKFELRYLDNLIGPYPETEDRYKERSPVNKLNRIKAPVLILQGDKDQVVPLNQAVSLYDKLRLTNKGTKLIRYPDEGHGFRNPETQINALTAELDFYRKNLG
jgi:dipeptidyl aminopeptidase/acylaminoacyl peptidase